MPRRITAHDLADYSRCPRAWWYERHEPLARLPMPALEEKLRARRSAIGCRRSDADPEIQVILRLLERHRRFDHGRVVHRLAADGPRQRRGIGCLPALALLLLTLAVLLWH